MRRNTAAISRRLEGEHRKLDETTDPGAMSDNELWASIYRLQARRNPGLRDRIRASVG